MSGWNFNNSYTSLPETFFSNVMPAKVREPRLIIFNQSLASELGLQFADSADDKQLLADWFSGQQIPSGAQPIAQAYAGHQFGHFTMLGDGRAILLGEQLTPEGKRVDIQFKGSGLTPYSRRGDGKAALGPMLREYIISEAMHALGIPTTRSLAVCTTGEVVHRETELPAAVLTRVAASHMRVGTFEYASAWSTPDFYRTLVEYALQRHFPHIEVTGSERYLVFLREVVARQASLIAKWQMVGFVHGVMNTDNMAISGETIDYGPCAFMDTYNPATVFSSIDTQGRYAYGNQPQIAAWNLAMLARTLVPLLTEELGSEQQISFQKAEEQAVQSLQAEIQQFFVKYREHWIHGMGTKLGLAEMESGDEELIEDLLALMEKNRTDYTNTFRDLTRGWERDSFLFETADYQQWRERWQARLTKQGEPKETVRRRMEAVNPQVIPRNERVEEALAAAVEQHDLTVMERLLAVLANPYDYSQTYDEHYTEPQKSVRPYRTFCGT